jgi:MoaA/NifB/PqqE/SkfB family radical SAM enzyme
MPNDFPRSVDFIVTEDCNLKCPVCWGSDMPDYVSLPIEERKRLSDILVSEGVEQAVFTGGEPLLDTALTEIIAHTHNSMRTWLFTNAILLPQIKDEVLPHTDRISFSLDGPNEEVNTLARRKEHYNTVLNAMEILRKDYPQIRAQVLTVVTRLNMDYLTEIGEVLEREKGDLEFRWKLNYYQPIGRFNDRYRLGYDVFKDTAENTAREFRGRLKVRFSIPEHDIGYLFIMPDGQMYTTIGSRYVSAGNLRETSTYDMGILHSVRDNIVRRGEEIAKQAELQR